MHTEILTTMLVFLSSTNREIVKSVLGFVKLVIHTLPADLLEPHLKELVPTLLARSHDHKNHFKVKVRHIFERILRRFAWDKIYSYAGEDDAAKVLVNIKKRKDRAKRKKASRNEDDDDDDVRLLISLSTLAAYYFPSPLRCPQPRSPLVMLSRTSYMEVRANWKIAMTMKLLVFPAVSQREMLWIMEPVCD
jgi:hypothetical protein